MPGKQDGPRAAAPAPRHAQLNLAPVPNGPCPEAHPPRPRPRPPPYPPRPPPYPAGSRGFTDSAEHAQGGLLACTPTASKGEQGRGGLPCPNPLHQQLLHDTEARHAWSRGRTAAVGAATIAAICRQPSRECYCQALRSGGAHSHDQETRQEPGAPPAAPACPASTAVLLHSRPRPTAVAAVELAPGRALGRRAVGAGDLDGLLPAVLAGLDVELHRLSLAQRAEPLSMDRGLVHKQVLPACRERQRHPHVWLGRCPGAALRWAAGGQRRRKGAPYTALRSAARCCAHPGRG